MASKHTVTGQVMAGHIDRIEDATNEIQKLLNDWLKNPSRDPFEMVQLVGRINALVVEQVQPGISDARRVIQGKSR